MGYDKGKESGDNELSQAGQSWGKPNQTNPGRPNAYAEYLAYKQKVQARQQSLALEQALQQLLVQEQAARTYAGPQAFAYNGADGTGGTGSSGGIDGGYEAGDSFGPSDLDGGAGADSAFPATGINESIDQVLSKGGKETLKGKSYSPQNVGKNYKGHGEVINYIPVEKLNGIYNGNSSDIHHYINRVMSRNINTTDIYNTFKNPIVVLSQWKGQRFLYVSDSAAVIINHKGELITVWSRKDFGIILEQILKEAY